jgi:hypothetical protein
MNRYKYNKKEMNFRIICKNNKKKIKNNKGFMNLLIDM